MQTPFSLATILRLKPCGKIKYFLSWLMHLKYDIYKKKVENKMKKNMLGDELHSLADTLNSQGQKRILKRLVEDRH